LLLSGVVGVAYLLLRLLDLLSLLDQLSLELGTPLTELSGLLAFLVGTLDLLGDLRLELCSNNWLVGE